MENISRRERIKELTRILDEDRAFFKSMAQQEIFTDKTSGLLLKMAGPGAIEIGMAIEKDPELVDVLVSDDIRFENINTTTLQHAWEAMSFWRDELAPAFLSKLRSADIDPSQAICFNSLVSQGSGKAVLADIANEQESEARQARLIETLSTAMGVLFTNPYVARKTPWPLPDMIHAYFDVIDPPRRAENATVMLDNVMDYLSHEDEFDEKAASEAIRALADFGAEIERPRTALYAEDEQIDHPNLVQEALYKERRQVAATLVELGADWKLAWNDPVVGRSARNILRNHPVVRRDRLSEKSQKAARSNDIPKPKLKF